MKNHEEEFWRDLDDTMKKLPDAIRTLQSVTGKRGMENIEPFGENRFEKAFMEAFVVLWDMEALLRTGNPISVSVQKAIKELNENPPEGLLGYYETGPVQYFPERGNVVWDKLNAVHPNLTSQWPKT